MKWEENLDYLAYRTLLKTIQDEIEVSRLLIDERCECIPYYYYFLKRYVVEVSKESTLIKKLNYLLEEYEKGAFLITNRGTYDLAWELGIPTESDMYNPCNEIPFDLDTFIFSWTSFMTVLCTQIKLQHCSLLSSQSSTGDNPECDCGDSLPNFNDWSSGVFPEDEGYCGRGCSKSW